MKDNADYLVIEDRPLPQRTGLLRDQIICMTKQAAQSGQPPFCGASSFTASNRTGYWSS